MQYGYFDNKNKEYVITNPRTPAPWINYIGNGAFGGIVSATGGGLTFDSDPSNRRVTRYKFNNCPMDRPGRYIYIRDEESGEYWSLGWQPVMKEGQEFECRHGLGYTTISGKYNGISSSVTYCVPLGKRYELWDVVLKNENNTPKKFKVYSYVEFSWNDAKYDLLAHWPCMAFRCDFDGKKIMLDTVAEQLTSMPQFDYIATNLDVIGYDCDLNKFVGQYRSESNPQVLDTGVCTNSSMMSNNCVGVLCSEIVLEAGESKAFKYTLGAHDDKNALDAQIDDAFAIEGYIDDIKKYWQEHCEKYVVDTPCDDMNTMLNIWHAYQAKTTFDWSRFISVYERGLDRGFGFRDSMQDVLGIMHAEPELAKERIKLLLSVQQQDGNAHRVYFPATKKSVPGGRSDDHLWSIFSVCNYIKETGNFDFANEIVPFVDGGEASVIDHLERGIDFTMNHLGKHGIPDLLMSDWDDGLAPMNKGGTLGAESVFVFFQVGHAALELIDLYTTMGLTDRAKKMQGIYDYCKSKMDIIWDGEWYIRAFTPEGEKYCTKDDEYNQIHLIPQAWSVISRLSDEKRANIAMDNVLKYLYTDFGLKTHYNPSDRYDPKNKSYYLHPAGSRENGGIFFHSNTWPIIAFTMLGRGDDAFKCYENMLPIRRNDKADLCFTEPYVYSQTMIAPPHKNAWTCVNSWLTGTASWTYLAATQYILGIRPEYKGLCVDPQVADDWSSFKITRKCRGTTFNISLNRTGEGKLFVNGEAIEGNHILWSYANGGTVEVVYNF